MPDSRKGSCFDVSRMHGWEAQVIRQLSVQQLREWQDQGAKTPLVLDVREPWEVNICAVPKSRHIPMRQIPVQLRELPQDNEIVVLCHHGHRSLHVADFLVRQGFQNVYNLHGGIDAWALEIDPTMSRY
jgi:rhodanese-related sulfurtransferase